MPTGAVLDPRRESDTESTLTASTAVKWLHTLRATHNRSRRTCKQFPFDLQLRFAWLLELRVSRKIFWRHNKRSGVRTKTRIRYAILTACAEKAVGVIKKLIFGMVHKQTATVRASTSRCQTACWPQTVQARPAAAATAAALTTPHRYA